MLKSGKPERCLIYEARVRRARLGQALVAKMETIIRNKSTGQEFVFRLTQGTISRFGCTKRHRPRDARPVSLSLSL
jgi:hypothetical protein